ncbi:MAG: glycosyltransferase, partial [Pseudoclavibacter sp.]
MLEGERQLLQPGYDLPGPVASTAPIPTSATTLRVLHLLTNSLPHAQSGSTLRSHAILRAQRDAGVEVLAVTRIGYPVTVGRVGADDADVVDGVEYRRVLASRLGRTPPARLRQQLRLLLPIAREFRPDVIHTTTHAPNAIVARALARALGVPWTYEVRGMLEKTWVASRATPEARTAAERSERFALSHAREAELAAAADHVFTLSTVMRDELADRGVPRERITLIPN